MVIIKVEGFSNRKQSRKNNTGDAHKYSDIHRSREKFDRKREIFAPKTIQNEQENHL